MDEHANRGQANDHTNGCLKFLSALASNAWRERVLQPTAYKIALTRQRRSFEKDTIAFAWRTNGATRKRAWRSAQNSNTIGGMKNTDVQF